MESIKEARVVASTILIVLVTILLSNCDLVQERYEWLCPAVFFCVEFINDVNPSV